MFLYILLFCTVFSVILFRFRRRRLYELASAIPGAEDELPLIGVAHTLAGNTEDILSTLQKYSYEAMRHGLVRAWLGYILYFIAVNPTDVEIVLKQCLEKDDLHRFIRKVTGFGGIFAPVAIWRKRRKIIVPAFSPKIVDNFVQIFSEQSDRLVVKLNEQEGRRKISVWPYLNAYTFDAVCESAMGVKLNAQNDPKVPFLTSLQIILNVVSKRIFHLWLQPDWLFKLFPEYALHEKHLKVLHEFTDDVINKKRQEVKMEETVHVTSSNDLDNYKNRSFLDILITLSGGDKGYTNQELREEVLTLTIAGTDTSAVAIGYVLKLLAKYPDVQDQVFHELQEVFGDSDRQLVKEDYSRLKYLDSVIRESIRLFPPVPFIIRKVLEELVLPSGKILPAGSGVVVSIWGIHRDPKYWGPDSECFNPERFMSESHKSLHECSYLPFSNGPRNCVGYQYAMMSMKTVVSSIVRNYKIVGDVECGPKLNIRSKLDIMMKAIDDYEIGLEKRTMNSKPV